MPYSRLNYRKRIQIETLLSQKVSISTIAKIIGCHRSTVYREIEKGKYQRKRTDWSEYQAYSADRGEAFAKFHRTTVGAQCKLGNDYAFLQYCSDMIKQRFSPSAILYNIKNQNIRFNTVVCRSTLYNYINNGYFLGISSKDLLLLWLSHFTFSQQIF